MLPRDLDRVVVVLVRARNPSNIGAVARAMHDLGYTHLRIVNEYPVPFAAAKSAVDASSVLALATEHTSVATAIADCSMVIGTTAVGERALQHPLYELSEATGRMQRHLQGDPAARVALLFGSEKTGLSNEELSHCQSLLTIPMNTRTETRHLSMNLGQAAAVCLYQLAQTDAPAVSPEPAGALSADLERLTVLLQEALEESGYTRRHPANSRETNVRRLVRRMGLTASDASVWAGILRQLLHGLKRAPSPSAEVPSPGHETEM